MPGRTLRQSLVKTVFNTESVMKTPYNKSVRRQQMSLDHYFDSLIKKVETSELDNQGKDDKGFFLPTRKVLLENLQMLKDLHAKPMAKPMLQTAWKFVTEHLPSEWLILSEKEKTELRKILG